MSLFPNNARRALTRALARFRDDRGVTLVELLIASISLIFVIGAAMGLVIVGLHQEPTTSARNERVSTARTTLERMTRELRQTYSVQTVGSNELSFFTYERVSGSSTSSTRFVSYRCDAGQCVRREGPVGQPLPESGTLVVEGVTNTDVFEFGPSTINPEYVQIRFALSIPDQTKRITVEDGVNLRNATNFWD